VPNRFASTGIEEPSTLSKRTPGLSRRGAGVDLGDLEHGRDRLAHADEAAALLQEGDEVAEGVEGHRPDPLDDPVRGLQGGADLDQPVDLSLRVVVVRRRPDEGWQVAGFGV
jgi:hypothetical protein